jgi:predicted TIM-barrel fold metal-dependent hydrolase
VNLTARQTAAIRNFVNRISGSQRMLAHGQLYPGVPNLEFMERQIQENHPDSWKGYNIAFAAKADDDPASPMRRWRLDDEKVVYPTYELITRHKEQLERHPGFFNICIHKGFSPSPVDTPEMGNPIDIPKASRDWPHFNFIIYHACWGGMVPFAWSRPVLDDILAERNYLNGVPNLPWLTQFGQTCGQLSNVYAEIGSTFANNVVTWPTVCAHMFGQLLKYFGEDRIVFGSDCVFNGSPQWQIEALWRFQIPDEMRRRFGYPELTPTAKRKILGLNLSQALQDPGPSTCRRRRPLQTAAARLREPDPGAAQDAARIPGPAAGQAGTRAARVPAGRGHAQPYTLWLGAYGLSRPRRRAKPALRVASSATCTSAAIGDC